MGFLGIGAGGAMQKTAKSLKRKPVSAFDKMKGYEDVKYKTGKIDKKATPEQLKEIRERLQKENRRNLIISILAVSSIIVLLYILFISF